MMGLKGYKPDALASQVSLHCQIYNSGVHWRQWWRLNTIYAEIFHRNFTYCSGLSLTDHRTLCYPEFHVNFWQYDDVIKWKPFPRNWTFVRGIHRSPVNFPHKDQWRGALMFSMICVSINGWVSNRESGDLRRYRDQYDVSVKKVHGALAPYPSVNSSQLVGQSGNYQVKYNNLTRMTACRYSTVQIAHGAFYRK